jgi:hypothetical protein
MGNTSGETETVRDGLEIPVGSEPIEVILLTPRWAGCGQVAVGEIGIYKLVF